MADPTRGLTLGKFAPLHRGHQLVIETGLAETDEMIVVVYDAPQVTTIPLSVRAGWIRRLHPEAQVVEAWGGPEEVGYEPRIMEAHERYLIDDLELRGVTHFYASEPYGEHVSRALGAVDRRVDPARERFPVSGREIRRNPYAFRHLVDPLVYRDLVVNVALLGAPATGKTTLAQRLAAELGTEWMPEFGREYWERHQVDRRLTPEQLVEIAEEHRRREDERLATSNQYLFTDTNALTTETFARYYHGRVHPRLLELADEAVARYDLFFLCDVDVPYEDTWDRSGEVNREVFQRQVVADLHRRKVPFFVLRGGIDERVARVRGILGRFRKYTNVLDLAGGLA